MSENPIKFILDNAGTFITALTQGTETEGDANDFLAPIFGFLDGFKEFDLIKILTDFGSTLRDIIASGQVPLIAGFQMPAGTVQAGLGVVTPKDYSGKTDPTPPAPITPTPEISPVKPTGYMSPKEAAEHAKPKVKSFVPTKRDDKPKRLARAKSAVMIDDAELNTAMEHINTTHGAITIIMSIVSVIGEIASLGQLDGLLSAFQSSYTLFDEPAAFYKLRDARIEMMYERPYRYKLESELQNVIPPPTDLGRFLAKELILPPEYDKTMTYWGISEYYADLYRRARYIELPANTIYELLHKGIINDAQAETLLKIADYNPTQIANLVELSYDYPNRTEIRVMARRTDIPTDMVKRALATSGLKEEYQPYLLDMLDNWNITSIQTNTIREGIRQYEQGIIQDLEFLELVVDNRASEAEAKAYHNEAAIKRTGRRKIERTKTIRKAFKHGLLTYSVSYEDEMKKHFPDLQEDEYNEHNVYFALMLELGYNLLDIELMLDKDRIDSKDVALIESMTELFAGVSDK